MTFTILNIPVQIHPTFWLFLVFFTNILQNPSIEGIILGIVLIFSLLVHEVGHALTAQYFGTKPTVTLEAFGGKAEYSSFGISAKQSFLITLNGPLLESLLIPLSYYLLKSNIFVDHYYVQYFLHVTMRLNILWCILNLLPITPLDGGHLMRYLLEKKFGSGGIKASLIVGLIFASLVIPYLYYLGFFFFGTLLLIFSFLNFQKMQNFTFSSAKENPFSWHVKGMKAFNNNDLETAKRIFKKLLKSKNKKIKHSAIESLAKVYLKENQKQKSYELLLNANHQYLKESKPLLCKLAYERKNYTLTSKYAREIYEIEPSYEIALLNSKVFGHLNQPELSKAWLKTASQFGDHPKETTTFSYK